MRIWVIAVSAVLLAVVPSIAKDGGGDGGGGGKGGGGSDGGGKGGGGDKGGGHSDSGGNGGGGGKGGHNDNGGRDSRGGDHDRSGGKSDHGAKANGSRNAADSSLGEGTSARGTRSSATSTTGSLSFGTQLTRAISSVLSAPATSADPQPSLPRALLPERGGVRLLPRSRAASLVASLPALQAPLREVTAAPEGAMSACRSVLRQAAALYGAARVEVAAAGPPQVLARGAFVLPIRARVVYAHAGDAEVRQARVSCRINGAGRVVAVR